MEAVCSRCSTSVLSPGVCHIQVKVPGKPQVDAIRIARVIPTLKNLGHK